MTLTELCKFTLRAFAEDKTSPVWVYIVYIQCISVCNQMLHYDLTWRHVLGDIKRIRDPGELGRVVVDVLDGDVKPHVGRLFPVVCAHQEGIFWTALPIQLLGGDQISGLGVDPEAVICPADDGVRHKSIGTLRWRQNKYYYYYIIRIYIIKSECLWHKTANLT